MTAQDLLKIVVDTGSSDLHLIAGLPPFLRTHGKLSPIENVPPLTPDQTRDLVVSLMSSKQQEKYLTQKELDFSVELPGRARFRVNAYVTRGTFAISLRLIANKISTIEELKLPPICHNFAKLKQGFVLVTGPTGSGKSSTLAAVIEEINLTRAEHILTIEDPVEFVYTPKKSIVSQREIGGDTLEWTNALRSALREDPNVVLIGEMRDLETMRAAMTTAETGHLVFATLHTNSAAQTIDRIVDSFPKEQQSQITSQLANVLEAVLSQRLIPSIDGKRAVATEIMVANPAVRTNIREGKSFQLDNIIQTGGDLGMNLFEMSLANLVHSRVVDRTVAMQHAIRPSLLARLIGEVA